MISTLSVNATIVSTDIGACHCGASAKVPLDLELELAWVEWVEPGLAVDLKFLEKN